MTSAWIKLLWYHLHEIFAVLILMALAWWLFPGCGHAYDSMTVNGDGSRTYTVTASTADGWVYRASAVSWADARDNATASIVDTNDQYAKAILGYQQIPSWELARTVEFFDLAGIPEGTVSAATIYLTANGCFGCVTGTTVFCNGSATIPLDIGDYQAWGTTELADRSAWTGGAWDDHAVVSVVLNDAGELDVAGKLGFIWQMWLLAAKDFDNEAPPDEEDPVAAGIYFADSAAAAYRPVLVFTMTPDTRNKIINLH